MFTDVFRLTVPAVKEKLPDICPAGTTTVAGRTIAGLSLTSATFTPADGAGALMATEPIPALPMVRLAFGMAKEDSAGVATVSVADRETPASDAVICTGVAAATGIVLTVNEADALPAGTVIVVGMEIVPEPSEANVTTAGLGVTSSNVTVPVTELPPVTDDGFRASEPIGDVGDISTR